MRSLPKACAVLLAIGWLGFSPTTQAELQDRGNGLIYDTVLDITWLQDANYALTSGYDCCDIYGGCDGDQYCDTDESCDENFHPSKMTWQQAVKWADQLNYQGFDDWRLASMSVSAGIPTGSTSKYDIVSCHADSEEACRDNELGYMFRYNLGGEIGDNFSVDPDEPNYDDPIIGVDGVALYHIQYGHWSNTAYLEYIEAFPFFFAGGGFFDAGQTTRWAAWAVRDGDVGDMHCMIPDDLTGLTATVRQDTVYLSWDESEGATQYNICWSIDGRDFIRLADVHETSYEDQLGVGWSTIDYSVMAVSTCGESEPSAVVRIENTTGGGSGGSGSGKGRKN